jgi:hypothetical protein
MAIDEIKMAGSEKVKVFCNRMTAASKLAKITKKANGTAADDGHQRRKSRCS